MKKKTNDDDKPIDLENVPHISIIIPFHPEISKPEGFFKRLALEAEKAEKELMRKYSKEQACPLVKKLLDAIKEVEFNTNGKSLAIFVSEVAKKIYYFTPSNRKEYMPPVLVKNND